MARPKHNYDHPDFYKLIEQLAMNGYTDEEIANELDLAADVFGSMKNGNYRGWSKRTNKERGERIYRVLARGRIKINALVRAAYLKSALGGNKIKSSTVRYVQDKCPCMGENKKCFDCGGTGWITLTNKSVIQETVSQLAPNIQALTTWLIHHDPEWRKIERKLDEDSNDIPTDIEEGINVEDWIRDKVNGRSDSEK